MEFLQQHAVQPPAPSKPTYIDLTESRSPTPPAAQHPPPIFPPGFPQGPQQVSPPLLPIPRPSSQSSHSRPNQPFAVSAMSNKPSAPSRPDGEATFGSSIRKPKSSQESRSKDYVRHIKPGTPGSFKSYNQGTQPFSRPPQPVFRPLQPSQMGLNPQIGGPPQPGYTPQAGYPQQFGYRPQNGSYTNGGPTWATNHFPRSDDLPRPNGSYHPFDRILPPGYRQGLSQPQSQIQPRRQRQPDDDREFFDLNAVQISAEDRVRYDGDADEHMRELLSGAIGDGEEGMGDDKIQEGQDVVEGFATGVRLMPHQVRGVRWMGNRESGRKYGGILADDMGLGKTVQTLARIVEGVATTAERKAGYKGGTLIIAPLAVMEQWATEVRTKTLPGRLKVTTHHGPSRSKSSKILEGYDVVITTFQTVASEHSAHEHRAKPAQVDSDSLDSDSDTVKPKRRVVKGKKQPPSALFDVKWLRVVVDEAQNIKNRKTKAAKAAVALQAKYRWCLTGTPIQNGVEELFSLFSFLRAKPLDNWEVFRERVVCAVKEGQTKIAMKRLHLILKAIMLRRTKDAKIDGKPILNLPERTVQVVRCPFDTEERAFYTELEQKTNFTLNKFVRAGTTMNNYTSVLTMLLRLRQACDHPSLVTKSIVYDKEALENKPAGREDEPDQADELADMLGGLGVNEGKACEMCLTRLENTTEKHCDGCRELAQTARAEYVEDGDGLPPQSAKIRMLLKLLNDVEERSEKKEKTIVFSQFTSFLNLIEPFLKKTGVAYVRYDGAMRNDKRQESLETIKSSLSVRVILISFKAGSTGLNLTCCNNVILMDLWWNPALEDQAFDRAHRLGQKLNVNIFKLTIEKTVEDRILDLQHAKREIAAAALSGEGAKNVMKLTLNDIMALFRSS